VSEAGPAYFWHRAGRLLASAPVHVYRWTLKPLVGNECRHEPSCSQYALDAIALNGGWRGSWLALGRIVRCRPGGTSGYDPAPDVSREHHRLAPWRYGRWR
jgi:putative membrane protein insertion efficiency factor